MNLTDEDLNRRIDKAYLDKNEPVRLALLELKQLAMGRELAKRLHKWHDLIPMEIIEAAQKVADFIEQGGWGKHWALGPICSRNNYEERQDAVSKLEAVTRSHESVTAILANAEEVRDEWCAEYTKLRDERDAALKVLWTIGLLPSAHETLEKAATAAFGIVQHLRRELADPPSDVQESVLKKLGLWDVISQRDAAIKERDELRIGLERQRVHARREIAKGIRTARRHLRTCKVGGMNAAWSHRKGEIAALRGVARMLRRN
jgi:hypothetical protein